jgi:hypothetical protein
MYICMFVLTSNYKLCIECQNVDLLDPILTAPRKGKVPTAGKAK